jgi:hypothetical protein
MLPCSAQCPRRSLVTTSGPMPGRRKLRPSSVSSRDSMLTSSDSDSASAAASSARACAGAGAGRGRSSSARPRSRIGLHRADGARKQAVLGLLAALLLALGHQRAGLALGRLAPRRCSSSRTWARSARLLNAPVHSSPRSAKLTTRPQPTTRWSSTRTSTSASADLQRLGEVLVGPRRLGHARRMVVRQDHRRCIARQGALDHLTRVHAGLADGAGEQRVQADQPVLVVEEQHGKHLVLQPAQVQLQVILDHLRRIEHRRVGQPLGQRRGGPSRPPPPARPAWPGPGP